MANLPPFLISKQQGNGNEPPSPGAPNGGTSSGKVPPQFLKGKNKKGNSGRQAAIARRMKSIAQQKR
jgi:hypothetical protein